MRISTQLTVAVLLPTHNGARFIWPQIRSLSDNSTNFTLHWLDDHSTDNTVDAVRRSASINNVALREWHQNDRLGVPGSFFRLLECVDADIYLFCDQDDIWQPGKIDFTVASLSPDVSEPVLAFTDMFMFDDDKPDTLRGTADFSPDGAVAAVIREHKPCVCLPSVGCAWGLTQGFTRGLRDILLRHIQVAYGHAMMHDSWMFDIAAASGDVRMLHDAPKALYRNHPDSFCAKLRRSDRRLPPWNRYGFSRAYVARHSRGLLLASQTLPSGPALERVVQLAQRLQSIDKRQSLVEVTQLARLKLFHPALRRSILVSCLCSDVSSVYPDGWLPS